MLSWRKMKTQAKGFSIMVMMPVFMVTMTMWWWQWHWWRLWRWFWRRWWWCWRILRRVRSGYKQRASYFRSTPSLFIRRQTAKHDHLSWQTIADDQGDCHVVKVLMRKQGCSSICAKSYKIAQVVTSHIFSFSILSTFRPSCSFQPSRSIGFNVVRLLRANASPASANSLSSNFFKACHPQPPSPHPTPLPNDICTRVQRHVGGAVLEDTGFNIWCHLPFVFKCAP